MDSTLLATKLRIPPRTRHLVRRARLVEALEGGVAGFKLVLISAPAGYGKTTLLAQWARASHFRVAWLSLGEEENDLARFFRSLLAAWEEIEPGVRESPLGLLLSAIGPDPQAVLSAFINLANDLPDLAVFVLDDYHLIDEPAVHDALTFLLDHLPPTLHVVLAGRAEPPLPLARYRARHELQEIRTEDLLFSVDETEEFLNQLMGLNLSDDEIAPLHARLEGWIAGLQLVSLSLRRHRDAVAGLAVSGRHHFIADYLSQEVLARLPAELRRFLLQTSVLDRLCGPLCDAVTGREGGQEVLELLERENLFLIPLDDHREWFRYHRLFADFLHEELRRHHPDEVVELNRRAARWFLVQDVPERAFEHAIAGDDPDLVLGIFDGYAYRMLLGGEFRVMQHWLDSLPAAWYAAYPALALPRAVLMAFSGAYEACLRCIDDVEQRLALAEGGTAGWQRAWVAAVRCVIACSQHDLPRAEAFADQALKDLPDDDLGVRPMILGSLGDAYREIGLWDQAKECYLRVLGFSHVPVFRVASVHVFGALADLDLRQGHLKEAAAYWRQALAAIQDQATWGRLPLPVTGWVYTRVGELLYEWNELEEAWDHLCRGLERSELGGDVRALIAGYVTAARIRLTAGDAESAGAYLERARPLVEQAPLPDWSSRFDRCQLELWLAQDRLRAAVDWCDRMLADGALEGRPEDDGAHLALARVLIVRGDAPARERALALLAGLLRAAEPADRIGVEIEALALRALAHWGGGDRSGALTALERALRLAEPQGYVRLFADLGLPMARLLQEARSRGLAPDYVGRLLAACGSDLAATVTGVSTLPEPLSRREREILGLIAAGLTNREIAERLVISPGTVKKHTANVFGKLGARHRAEAVARARALAVLD